jgi:putative transposase
MNSINPKEEHGRRSIRIPGYDYSTPGMYFITVVAFRRECLFGEIIKGTMKLSPIGEIIWREWYKTAELRPYVESWGNEFVVMPNHVHGIIRIIDEDEKFGSTVGARRRRAPTNTDNIEQFGKPVPGSIPTIVRAFKSAVTYCAGKELNSSNLWQSNYYEHIIRDDHDYERIAFYIAQNPSNWSEDEENPYISAL